MPVARKTTDAAPAVDGDEAAPASEQEAPLAEETPAVEAPVEEFLPPVDVVFHGQAQSLVARVGLCDPDGTYTVPAVVADEVCRGDAPLFTRAEKA